MLCRIQGMLEGGYGDSVQVSTILEVSRYSESISIYRIWKALS